VKKIESLHDLNTILQQKNAKLMSSINQNGVNKHEISLSSATVYTNNNSSKGEGLNTRLNSNQHSR
jgi:hypothetical protein